MSLAVAEGLGVGVADSGPCEDAPGRGDALNVGEPLTSGLAVPEYVGCTVDPPVGLAPGPVVSRGATVVGRGMAVVGLGAAVVGFGLAVVGFGAGAGAAGATDGAVAARAETEADRRTRLGVVAAGADSGVVPRAPGWSVEEGPDRHQWRWRTQVVRVAVDAADEAGLVAAWKDRWPELR